MSLHSQIIRMTFSQTRNGTFKGKCVSVVFLFDYLTNQKKKKYDEELFGHTNSCLPDLRNLPRIKTSVGAVSMFIKVIF